MLWNTPERANFAAGRVAAAVRALHRACAETMDRTFYLFVLMVLLMFICALLGMQTFGGTGVSDDSRWHFDYFFPAVLSVFTVTTGEWVDAMDPGIDVAGASAVFYYASVLIFGRFLLMNLLVAIVLDAFSDPESIGDEAPSSAPVAAPSPAPATALEFAPAPVADKKQGSTTKLKLQDKSKKNSLPKLTVPPSPGIFPGEGTSPANTPRATALRKVRSRRRSFKLGRRQGMRRFCLWTAQHISPICPTRPSRRL